MTDITVQIDTPQDIADRMSALAQNWQSYAYKALGEALSMDDVLGAIRKRTPRSELDSHWNLTKDGRRIINSDGTKIVRRKGKEVIVKSDYIPGMNNLRNDLKLQPITEGGSSRSFSLGFPNVGYAGDVHERDDERTNWTHSGTGSHFLSGVIEEQQDEIPTVITENIESMMRQDGII